MNAPSIALVSISLTTSCLLGCTVADDDIVDTDELGSLEVDVSRDGGDFYPRTLNVNIHLPWPHHQCATLASTMTFTLNGRPTLYGPSRGGVSPSPGLFGDPACEASAGATFRVPDEGGPLVVRIEQEGFQPAAIELDAPAIEPLELVAPADGHLRAGDIATVRVPPSFYVSRNITPPAPHALGNNYGGDAPEPFGHTLLVARGQDLADRSDRVIGDVGVGTKDVLAQVSIDATPGPKSLYVAYTYGPYFEPMPIRHCEGFASCTGKARDNFGVLGPLDVIVE